MVTRTRRTLGAVVTRWLVAALLVAVPGLAGCQDDQASRGADRYVALGDSFTSGAGLPRTRRDAFTCGQSSLNYPTLVAKAIGATLVDVSSTTSGTSAGSASR